MSAVFGRLKEAEQLAAKDRQLIACQQEQLARAQLSGRHRGAEVTTDRTKHPYSTQVGELCVISDTEVSRKPASLCYQARIQGGGGAGAGAHPGREGPAGAKARVPSSQGQKEGTLVSLEWLFNTIQACSSMLVTLYLTVMFDGATQDILFIIKIKWVIQLPFIGSVLSKKSCMVTKLSPCNWLVLLSLSVLTIDLCTPVHLYTCTP